MRHLWLDIETASPVSIADCGAYRYAMDPGFRILLIAYAVDDEPVRILECGSTDPFEYYYRVQPIFAALTDPEVVKHAHNATFERVCFTMTLRALGELGPDEWLDPAQWDCSMIQAARCGLPLSLKQCGGALHLEEQKMDEGKKLIALFCLPHPDRKSLDTDEDGFVRPGSYPEQWETFKTYCIRDVEVERGIARACAWYEASDFERRLYATDQRINDRGVRVDRPFVTAANRFDAVVKGRLSEEAVMLTGLDNPGSVVQLKGWIEEQLGRPLPGLTKQVVADLLAEDDLPLTVRKVLAIRAELGKTSTTKYSTMLDVMGREDDRARGLTQFYGTRTGRWAGRLVQLQNLPQNHLDALDAARRCVREGDYEGLELAFGNVPDTLSQLIRTAFVPAEGKVFAVCDFSAIEARVLAWLAGEDWVLDAFRAGKDIYCETASKMFKVPVEKHGQNAHLRQKGKVAVLALGYQGGTGALDKMGGARLGMTELEEAETVSMWRGANEHIVSFWGAVEAAAKQCITTGSDIEVRRPYAGVTFRMEGKTMTVELPSGRRICYPEACLKATDKWEALGVNTPIIDGEQQTFTNYAKRKVIAFRGLNQTTRKWEWVETYGGKITENITQAVARDCLANTMTLCEAEGFRVCFHIHDELVMEVERKEDLARIEEIFKITPAWAEGLPIKGAGYTGNYYFKD